MATPSHTSDGDERFFALSLDLLTVVGFDGLIKRLNPAWERELGWTPDEMIGQPYADFLHPDDRERSLAEAARLVDPAARTLGFELRVSRKDGGWRWLLISARGVAEEEAIYAVGKDITDRKAAEQALAQSEERFRAVAESVTDAIVSADADGRIVLWNPAAERAFGYTATEAIGMHTVELVGAAHRQAHLDGYERLRRGGEPRIVGRSVEVEARRRDGSEFPVELSLGRWRSEANPFYVAVVRDISERRLREAYVAAQHAVDRVLVESPPVERAMPRILEALGRAMGWSAGGYWALDPDDDRLRCEAFWAAEPERAREFERLSRELVLRRGDGLPGQVLAEGRPVWVTDITDEARFARGAAALGAGLRGAVALPVVTGGGQVVAVLDFFAAELRGPDEELTSMMAAISTQVGQYLRRKQAEAALAATAAELRRRARELERSNAELEQFAYVASHDLAEPLRMISGFVGLLAQRYRGRLDADADEFIGYTVDGVERMQALISGLLAYSRVGREEHAEPVDLAGVVDDALAALGAAMAERDAHVEVGELPAVMGDRRELAQLFQNLLSNAIKFVPEGTPRVEVAARREGERWAVSVRDNGIGIEPRHAERIFKMFQRLHARDEYPGTGIGLAICEKIVERHGGEIRVDAAPGGGSVFTVTLPAAPEEAA